VSRCRPGEGRQALKLQCCLSPPYSPSQSPVRRCGASNTRVCGLPPPPDAVHQLSLPLTLLPSAISACLCRLGVREDAGHDAVLLMDRVMSTGLQLAPDLLDLLAVGCVIIAARQVDGPAGMPPLPPDAVVSAACGLPAPAVEQMEWNIRQVLSQDTAAISTLRCLKLFLERMGAHHMDGPSAASLTGRASALVSEWVERGRGGSRSGHRTQRNQACLVCRLRGVLGCLMSPCLAVLARLREAIVGLKPHPPSPPAPDATTPCLHPACPPPGQ
jgi:hypothetical protein